MIDSHIKLGYIQLRKTVVEALKFPSVRDSYFVATCPPTIVYKFPGLMNSPYLLRQWHEAFGERFPHHGDLCLLNVAP